MNRIVLLLTILFFYIVNAQAQNSVEDSVKTAVNRLFEGMKEADGAKVRSAFADSAILQTIGRDKEGRTVIRNQAVAGFADFVGKQKAGAADERIEFGTIRIDGPLAIVWTPYKFYFNGKFSHCGVNSFQLVRLNGEWKIQYLIDTRRKDGCE
jgi:hypothetical protein